MQASSCMTCPARSCRRCFRQTHRTSASTIVDSVNDTLFVAFETVGLYRLRRVSSLPALVNIGKDQLIEPVKTFGVTYHAILDDGEFECQYAPEDPAQPGDVVAIGSAANAGEFLEAAPAGGRIFRTRP